MKIIFYFVFSNVRSYTVLNSKSQLIGKDPDAGRDWGWEEKAVTEDDMVGWHYWFNGHEWAKSGK